VPPLRRGERDRGDQPSSLRRVVVCDGGLQVLAQRRRLAKLPAQPPKQAHHRLITELHARTLPCRLSFVVYPPRVSFHSVDDLEAALRAADYLPDRGLATALFLATALEKPVLLEGEAGVGKTEAAKALARAEDARLIRLQCYEGLDVAHAVYEWNYTRQLLHIRAAQEGTVSEEELFGPAFLIRRPLLEAIEADDRVVLLVDEIDRADEEFEAFLLEVLSDFQITIPELGTIRARRRPVVVLTSNRTRDLHDALKRRCLFHWIEHPSLEREVEIVRLKVPDVAERLAIDAAAFVQALRRLDLEKPPGVAETIDWAHALTALGSSDVDEEVVEATLGSLLKVREDVQALRDGRVGELLADARGTPDV
jgi:MoxR-like ATPase